MNVWDLQEHEQGACSSDDEIPMAAQWCPEMASPDVAESDEYHGDSTSWAGEMMRCLDPDVAKIVQSRCLHVATACSGTDSPLHGLEVAALESH